MGTLEDTFAARHAAYLSTAHFASLDGLRFFSIVPVVWHHSTLGPLPGVLGKGPLGVELFFAISGFLITTRLVREQRARGDVAVRQFYARRALRIFPLYYAVLGVYALRAWLVLPASPERAHFLRSLPFWATYTADWFVDVAVTHPIIFSFGWSLAVEEQFYLLWPWIVRATRGALFPVGAALLLLAADQSVERGLFAGSLPASGLAHRMITSLSTPICLGALLACVLDRPRSFAAAMRLLGHRASAPLAFLALAALVIADGAPLFAVHVALALLVGACCARPDHGLAAITDAVPLRWVGTVSYGVYLLHVSAITAWKRVLPAAWISAPLVFALSFAVSLGLAAASYRWFERPFLRLGDRFRGARPLRAAPVLR
uniref:Acyltransferase 3 n=1 Tax=Aetherobacter rufus TaxID=888831 RepID=A0A3Q8I1M6_9BACT|nr:acyltransferase 3 [Aetherobacter rufus]